MRQLVALCVLAGCGSHAAKKMMPAQVTVSGRIVDKVDVLFMMADTQGTPPKIQGAVARFPALMNVLNSATPASYHIGVVTSDLGSAQSLDAGCTPGGLGGKLQVVGRAAKYQPYPDGMPCAPVTGGLGFIDYNLQSATNNLPSGASLEHQFACMSDVGTAGCGFDSPLESVYKALHDCMPDAYGNYPGCTIPENKGFLRPDSLLAIMWVIDEDDCSAPPDSDLFDLNAPYGPLLSFRCTKWGIECLQNGMETQVPDDSNGPMMGCMSWPNPDGTGPGKLYDVSRYIDFFNSQVRSNSNDVILAAIDAPSTPFSTFYGNPSTYAPCSTPPDGKNCTPLLQHSCNASMAFFADPAVRINQVLAAAPNGQQDSVCAPDYADAMTAFGNAIAARLNGAICVGASVANPSAPNCTVVQIATDGTKTNLPACGTAAPPCWNLITQTGCPWSCGADGSTQQLAISIFDGGQPAPAGATTQATCDVLSEAQKAPTCPSPSPSPGP
jgi:hypothetical protein